MLHLKRARVAAVVSCLALWAVTGHAQGETLKEALASAYLYNPTLKAARAQLRAIDEEVPRAKSGWRPRIFGNVQQSFQDTSTRTRGGAGGGVAQLPVQGGNSTGNEFVELPIGGGGGGGGGTSWPRTYSIQAEQNIFDGFQTFNAVRGAEALVEAGREDLRSTEQQILLDATTAFIDVVRDQAVVELRENNVKVLAEQLRATEDRFEVGEVTRTDVAQARARLSTARSELSAARAALQVSRANFQRLIGHPPSNLRAPGPVAKLLPPSLERALAAGEHQNPQIIAAVFRERSAKHDIKRIKGELLPQVSLQASYTKGFDLSPSTLESDETRVTANVDVPIYQAGEVSARIRQAQETRSQRLQQIDEAREQIRANVIAAWGELLSARAQIESEQVSVEANRVALEGVREEERVGQRTVLDVLDAEQALVASQVNLVTARRNLVVASYQLLTAIGRLSAYDIALQTELYDPAAHYSRVANKWYGWEISVESAEDPVVAPVTDPGRHPGQPKELGPAYVQGGRSWLPSLGCDPNGVKKCD